MRKFIIVLAVGLLALYFMVVSGCQSQSTPAAVASSPAANLNFEVAALTTLANQQTTANLNILKSLAVTPEVQSADWKQINPLLTALSQSDLKARVFLILLDGASYIPGQNEAASNLSDRDYFKPLLAGNVTVGNLVVGKVSSNNSYIIAVPVFRDGRVVAALGTTPYLEESSENLSNSLGLRNTRFWSAQTSDGTIALCSDLSLIMTKNLPALKNAVYQNSSLTGWKFSLAAK
jgi:hypothetical protein